MTQAITGGPDVVCVNIHMDKMGEVVGTPMK